LKEVINILNNSRILITGGAGFIGVNLVNYLLEKKIVPYILDIYPYKKIKNDCFIPNNFSNASYIKADITNRNQIKKIISKIAPDYVIHLASMTDLQKNFESGYKSVSVNINGTLIALESLSETNIKGAVLLSTSDVYGGCDPPFKEDQRIEPASPYSISKASSEMYTQLFSKIYNIPITILRCFNVFGEYQRTNRIIPYIIINLLKNKEVKLTGGKQKREFNYIRNVIDAILLALIKEKSHGKIINIGNGNSYSIKYIATKIGNKIGKIEKLKFGAVAYRNNEIWDMYCDNSLAKVLLNWKPEVSFEDGLVKTIEWYQNNYLDCIKE